MRTRIMLFTVMFVLTSVVVGVASGAANEPSPFDSPLRPTTTSVTVVSTPSPVAKATGGATKAAPSKTPLPTRIVTQTSVATTTVTTKPKAVVTSTPVACKVPEGYSLQDLISSFTVSNHAYDVAFDIEASVIRITTEDHESYEVPICKKACIRSVTLNLDKKPFAYMEYQLCGRALYTKVSMPVGWKP